MQFVDSLQQEASLCFVAKIWSIWSINPINLFRKFKKVAHFCHCNKCIKRLLRFLKVSTTGLIIPYDSIKNWVEYSPSPAKGPSINYADLILGIFGPGLPRIFVDTFIKWSIGWLPIPKISSWHKDALKIMAEDVSQNIR